MRVARAIPVPAREYVRAHVPHALWVQLRDVANGKTLPQQATRALRRRVAASVVRTTERHSVPVTVAGRVLAAVPVETFAASRALEENLALVADALEAAGVPYVVIDSRQGTRRVVMVREDHRAKVFSALATTGSESLYAAPVRDRAVGRPRRVSRVPRSRPAPVYRFFRIHASPGGTLLGGAELGCDVEFWPVSTAFRHTEYNGEKIPPGSLLAPRANRWASLLLPDEQETTTAEVGGSPRPVLAAFTHPHVESVQFPVDVVYTWVDGNDPDWMARKAAALAEAGGDASGLHRLAMNDSRFQSRDELRYSMRSLDMYADWVRHVYLVTDDQVPPWLDTSNPKLTVVSHRELFGDRGQLPTFNSHAIETQLHRIDGLSEQYLYLNDDVFFGRPVSPEHFFHANGVSKYFISKAKIGVGPISPDDPPVMSAGKRNRDLVAEEFGVTITNKFWHVPHALRRSVMEEIEDRFPGDVKRTAASQFRSPDDISMSASLGHYVGFLTNRAAPGRLRYFYADIARPDTPARLATLVDERGFDVFCLNDHDSGGLDPQEQLRIVGGFLDAYFPLPSSFERP